MPACRQCGVELPNGFPDDGLCPECVTRGSTLEIDVSGKGDTVPKSENGSVSLAPEADFGPYRIISEIGRGGMGVVYRAVEVSLRRDVALKVLLAGERATREQASRFLREAQSAGNLHHPNVVPVYGAGTERDVPYFAMEFVEGQSLEVVAQEPLDIQRAIRITRDVARALHYSHQQGIVHRDIKPGNILIDPQGRPRITDFGLAKVMGDKTALTQEGTALGTPAYMSPEQASGDISNVGPTSDLYSLGAVFYEMLAGKPPFLAETPLQLMAMIQVEDPAPLRRLRPEIPRDVQTVCFKALEKDPKDRYADLEAFASDLDRLLAGDSILAKPPSALQRVGRWVRRQRVPLVAAGLAFFIAGAAVSAIFLSHGPPRPMPPLPELPKTFPMAPPERVSPAAHREAGLQMDIGRNAMARAEKSFFLERPGDRRALLLEATEAFAKACTADPMRAEAFLERGRTLAMLERFEPALASFTRAIELNPDLTDAYYGRVQIRHKHYMQLYLLGGRRSASGLRDQIEADLKRIEEIGAKPWKFHTGRAALYQVELKFDAAFDEIEAALDADASFADAYAVRGNVYLMKGFQDSRREEKATLEKALADFKKAAQLSGGEAAYRTNIAQILLALKRPREALVEANAVVQALPENPFSLLVRAQIHKALGDEDAYDADMDRADQLPLDNPDVHFAVTASLIRSTFRAGGWESIRFKDVSRTHRYIDRYLQSHPERTDLLGPRGMLRMLLGKPKQGAADLQTYLKNHPDSQLAPAFSTALVLTQAGADLSLKSPGVFLQLAFEHLEKGDLKSAEGLLRRALQMAENFSGKGRPMGRRFLNPSRIGLARVLCRKAATIEDEGKRAKTLDQAIAQLEQVAASAPAERKTMWARLDDFAILRDDPRFQALLPR